MNVIESDIYIKISLLALFIILFHFIFSLLLFFFVKIFSHIPASSIHFHLESVPFFFFLFLFNICNHSWVYNFNRIECAAQPRRSYYSVVWCKIFYHSFNYSLECWFIDWPKFVLFHFFFWNFIFHLFLRS